MERIALKDYSIVAIPRAFVVMVMAMVGLLLGGCAATLEEFQQMSAYQRAQYVCDSHQHIRFLETQMNSANSAVEEVRTVIARGYRLHKSCKEVLVPDKETCFLLEEKLICEQKTTYKTVCEETPVAIDGDLEKGKLRRYKKEHYQLQDKLDVAIEECLNRVNGMDAASAYEYYETVR